MDENNILQEYMYLSESNKNYIPFGRDASDNLICFDYSIGKNPCVVFIELEEDEDSVDRVYLISDTFDGFLDMLCE